MQFWKPKKNCNMGRQEVLNTKYWFTWIAIKKGEIEYEQYDQSSKQVNILKKIHEIQEKKKHFTHS